MTSDSPMPPEPSTPEEGSSGGRPDSTTDKELIAAALKQGRGKSASASGTTLPRTIPGYEIVRELHRGGQGVVFQAVQRSTKRKVALKVLYDNPLEGSKGRARFEREVEVLSQLDHPNIVGVLDSGEADGSFWYAMDYISGVTLRELIDRTRDTPMAISDALALFAKVCDAVNAAHLAGVIHRDLKPSNVIVDGRGEPHIVDFGLAKVGVGSVTHTSKVELMTVTGQFIGSLPWASPEQAEGRSNALDVRTDVYSLGVMLYQLLTGGRFPYEVIGHMKDVLDNILRRAPDRPSTVRRQIRDEVETIVLKALSKERERRYQTAGELGRDLQRYLAGEPIEAKRDSGWYVVRTTVRRYRVPAAIGGGLIAATVVVAVVMSVLWSRAKDAEARAEAALVAERTALEETREAYENVREMATSLVFEFGDEVRDLRGGTEAHRLVVERGQEHLATLRGRLDGAEEDAAYLLELADAHDRLGDLASGPGGQRLHRSDVAREAYEAARAIREDLRDRREDDPELTWALARSRAALAWLARLDDDDAAAMDGYLAAIDLADRAIGLVEPTRDGAAGLKLDIAHDRARWLLLAGDMEERALLAAAQRMDGETAADRAQDFYRRARSAWDGSARDADADDERRRRAEAGVASAQRSSAELSVLRGRLAMGRVDDEGEAALSEAVERFLAGRDAARAAAARFAALAEGQPERAEWRREWWRCLHAAGDGAMRGAEAAGRLGDAARRTELDSEALELFEAALSIAEGLSREDGSNREAARDVARVLNKVARQQLALGRHDDALRGFERSLAIRREVEAGDPVPDHTIDVAVALFRLGDFFERHAEAEPAARSERLERSVEYFARALATMRRLADAGALGQDDRRLASMARAVERVRGKLGDEG